MRTHPVASIGIASFASMVLIVVAVVSLLPHDASASGGPGTVVTFLPAPGPNNYLLPNNGPPLTINVQVTTTLDVVEQGGISPHLNIRLVDEDVFSDDLLDRGTFNVTPATDCVGGVAAGPCTITVPFTIQCVNNEVIGPLGNSGESVAELAIEFGLALPGGDNYGSAIASCFTPTPAPFPSPVGGIVELPYIDQGEVAASAGSGSGLSSGGIAAITAAMVAAAVVAAGGWYGRRRWLRRE